MAFPKVFLLTCAVQAAKDRPLLAQVQVEALPVVQAAETQSAAQPKPTQKLTAAQLVVGQLAVGRPSLLEGDISWVERMLSHYAHACKLAASHAGG